jgi:hypothetical protein
VVMLIRREVRRRPLELECAQRGGGEVERGLGMAPSPQRVERPDHPGCTDVESLQRQRLLPPLPFVGRPERVGIERCVGVGDDRRDRILDVCRIPGLVGQRLELRWFVEHGASLREGHPAPTRQSPGVEWRREPRLAPPLERASQRVTVVVSVALLSVRFGSG